MKIISGALAGLAVMAGMATTLQAADPVGGAGASRLWGVGRTGVLCYQEPCPRRGIFPISPSGERGRPLSGTEPSEVLLSGEDADIAHIRSVYRMNGCLVVQGRLVQTVLHVERIVGAC